ncbi:T9SS type A sorting domain-containing protein [Aquimarina sp. 2201CG14-23]|uniref:T9SS type A sorting domain-containing protein n=1 Tax=Aquimarina mycalae TaxID=3040073 RepID=UPI0024780AB6|nr:T9SS type A sorting domain-containing protein [Aquimarina sp. 2201CG14-23]MDH7448225.1 T9SS type A sorting domain-containing protein [Aquimarina sp. 2201CG14-23]
MKSLFTLLLVILSQSLFSQSGSVFYMVNGIPPGASSIDIFVDFQVDNFPDNEALGSVFFSVEEIDEVNISSPIYTGTVLGFIEFVLEEGQSTFSETINLNPGITLTDELPTGRVYRIVAEGGVIQDINTFENLGVMSALPLYQKLDVGGNIFDSRINVSFIEKPKEVILNDNFIIKTEINTGTLPEFDFGEIRFQIHEVDEADVYTLEDVPNQTFISQSSAIVINSSGTVNHDFTLAAPSVLTNNLPSGRVYRVRVLNTGTTKTYPFPYKLTVSTTLTVDDFNTSSQKIAFYPNPAIDRIIIDTNIDTDSYRVYSLSGKMIKEEKAMGTLEVGDLTTGIYFLVTDSGTTKFIKK